jgi:3,4-dihydroxy 2-butanone 4-phosphate synthase / GTP cyclohydrolase II
MEEGYQTLCDPFPEALAHYQQGGMIILIDDEDRENEGDLVVATEKITADQLAFMARHGRGLTCVSISEETATLLRLPLQSPLNQSPFGTPFAVTIDHASVVGRGGLPSSIALTLHRIVAADASPDDFVCPGHVFPLIAHSSGVLGRRGQTEGSLELSRFAGLRPSGVICEILRSDGEMARGQELRAFADTYGLKIASVEQLVRHRLESESFVRISANSLLETDHGVFHVYVFEDDASRKEHMALVYGDPVSQSAPLIRLHSECLTGDVFGSSRCDCGEQLDIAMCAIVKAGAGIVLYLRQEGRGIGLENKMRAYELQDQGKDTVEANVCLGFRPDERDFSVAVHMLQALSVSKVRLLTNNPLKVQRLQELGISVLERVPIVVPPTGDNRSYLSAKREKMGHVM